MILNNYEYLYPDNGYPSLKINSYIFICIILLLLEFFNK